jgi:hypothetical protein
MNSNPSNLTFLTSISDHLNHEKTREKSQSWKKRVQNKEKLNYNKNAMKFLAKQILSFEKKKGTK